MSDNMDAPSCDEHGLIECSICLRPAITEWKPNPWMETYTGKRPVIGDMTAATVDMMDVGTSLSRMTRFLGHCKVFYSVAEHSVLVSEALEYYGASTKEVFAGLMHDAKEAYIGDMPTPVKRAFAQHCIDFNSVKKQIEYNADRAICEYVGWITPEDIRSMLIVSADLGALKVEANFLCVSGGRNWTYTSEPMEFKEEIVKQHGGWGWDTSQAYDRFMARYDLLKLRLEREHESSSNDQ